ncbi:MAG TPA: gluconate 2-dehydrogenase subunit 3 family protein [Puia sp.]|nr:gluconate 2-dehydrogenase subunit 3 family protein [Puia sp.]
MTITRRTALQRMFIVAGGVVLLPACGRNNDNHDENQETLEALADTLLPAGSTPADQTLGAKAAGAHLFAARMIRDCYPKAQQEQYMRGLEAFNQQARSKYGKPFAECNQGQRDALVSAINASTGQKTDDLSFFFRENKNLVMQGYLGSQYFLTKIEVYELVPGRWHGCTPVVKQSHKQS